MRYIYNAEKGNFSKKTIFRRLFISTVLNNIGTRSEFRFLLIDVSRQIVRRDQYKKEGRILDQKSQNIETNPIHLLLNIC